MANIFIPFKDQLTSGRVSNLLVQLAEETGYLLRATQEIGLTAGADVPSRRCRSITGRIMDREETFDLTFTALQGDQLPEAHPYISKNELDPKKFAGLSIMYDTTGKVAMNNVKDYLENLSLVAIPFYSDESCDD